MRRSSIIVCCLTLALSFSNINGNARICFSCTNLRPGDTCEKAISCRDNEVCFTQKYKGEDNTTYYSLGCAYPELCRKDDTGIVFGKRSFEHSHVLCHKCCPENVCNSNLECTDTYIGQSLKCLSCSGVATPSQCTNTTTCGVDEECFVQKYQSGGRTYHDLGCKRSTSCFKRQNVHIVGKRTEVEVHLTCSACCNGNNLCNRYLDCNHTAQHSYNSSCVINSECSSNFVCNYGICTCPNDDFYFGNDACYLYKSIDQPCVNSLQCKVPLTCHDRSCRCQAIEFWNGTSCLKRKTILEQCNSTDECSDTLYCNHGECNCARLDFWTGQKCIERKTFNESCRSDIDCIKVQKCETNRCKCHQSFWTGETCTSNRPYECDDLNITSSGVYLIYPINSSPVHVYCIVKGGEKWTVFQHRFDESVSFYRTWSEYKNGFGDPHGEYWLGNENIHIISSSQRHKLRVELTSPAGKSGYAEYSVFIVQSEAMKYRLNVTGYSGTTGDSLDKVGLVGRANGQAFSTYDRDNDASSRNCGSILHSGWWFYNCEFANLNIDIKVDALSWNYNFGSVSSSLMMITKF